MRTSTLRLSAITLGSALLLSACGNAHVTSINQENLNPLTASRYSDELADTLADMIIQNESGALAMRTKIEGEISQAKQIGVQARELIQAGVMGQIIPVKEEVIGYALYLDDMLYLSSDFVSKPGTNLHVYLTTVVDPRDVSFPDTTAIDLGAIQTVYGAQQFAVPKQEKPELLRTFVLWDKGFNRLYGFAQLTRTN